MSIQPDILISKEDTKKRVLALRSHPDESACLIFGAGASYGYSDEHFYKPPIVKDLFNESNSVVGEIINRPEHRFIKNNKSDFSRELSGYDNDLEKYLSSLYSRNSDDNLFGNFLAYLEDIFFLSSTGVVSGTSNNYRTLINLMWGLHGKKPWSCVSFNYDTILEKSYLIAGRDTTNRRFNSRENYVGSIPVILKMHGGINFRYMFNKSLEDSDKINHTPHVLFSRMMSDNRSPSDFLRVIDPEQGKPDQYSISTILDKEKTRRNLSYFNFPLMLIPIHASITPENTFFREQINLAGQQVEKAGLIIAIGYNFGDEAFTDGLSKIDFSNKEIILVGSLKTSKDPDNHLEILESIAPPFENKTDKKQFDLFFVSGRLVLEGSINPKAMKEEYGTENAKVVVMSVVPSYLTDVKNKNVGADYFHDKIPLGGAINVKDLSEEEQGLLRSYLN